MHIDFNSFFATVEQQANPFLRGKPIAVAAYNSSGGCIVAPSIEAKKMGIKVGMRVGDGKKICRDLIVLTPDPAKYRSTHLVLRKILSTYTDEFFPKSIDEFVLDLNGYPCLEKHYRDTCKEVPCTVVAQSKIHSVAREIKKRIKKEVGEWMTVSVGIAPNRFLAKLASSLHKPDGLDEINADNFLKIYSGLELADLCGIDVRNTARLNSVGIFSVCDFYNAEFCKLKAAFKSVNARYWYFRLRGWEIDNVEFSRRSFGNSYVLPARHASVGVAGGPKLFQTPTELSPILSKLTEKIGARLRRAGYQAKGIHLSIVYRDWTRWQKGITFAKTLFDSRDFYKTAFRILHDSLFRKPVRKTSRFSF